MKSLFNQNHKSINEKLITNLEDDTELFKTDSHWMTKMKSPNENDIAYSDQLAVQKIKVYWYINLQIPLAYYIF